MGMRLVVLCSLAVAAESYDLDLSNFVAHKAQPRTRQKDEKAKDGPGTMLPHHREWTEVTSPLNVFVTGSVALGICAVLTAAQGSDWAEQIETKLPKAKMKDIEQVCPDVLARCKLDDACTKNLELTLDGKPNGKSTGTLAELIKCFRDQENHESRNKQSLNRYEKTKKVVDDVACSMCEYLVADMWSLLARKATEKKFKGGERAARELLEELCTLPSDRLNRYVGLFEIHKPSPQKGGPHKLVRDAPWGDHRDDHYLALDVDERFHADIGRKVSDENRQWQMHTFTLSCITRLKEVGDEITEAVGAAVTANRPKLKEAAASGPAELAALITEVVEESDLMVRSCATMCDIPIDDEDEDDDEDEEEEEEPKKKKKKKKSKKKKQKKQKKKDDL